MHLGLDLTWQPLAVVPHYYLHNYWHEYLPILEQLHLTMLIAGAAPNKTAPFTTGVADSKRSKKVGDGKPKFLMTNLPIGDFANVWY